MNNTLQYWRDGNHQITLAEASLLIIEEYPDNWVNSKTLFEEPPHGFIPIYRGMRAAATTVINAYGLSEEDASESCIEYELHTDKLENVQKISEEDGLSVYVGQSQLKKWIKSKGISARFFTDDSLTEFKPGEKAFGARERNSLLVIIGVLANEQKIDLKTPSKSAKLILKMADEMGISIDDETISKNLKLIQDALDRRTK